MCYVQSSSGTAVANGCMYAARVVSFWRGREGVRVALELTRDRVRGALRVRVLSSFIDLGRGHLFFHGART